MDFLKEMYEFIKTRKKYWLIPLIIILLFFGTLLFITAGSAAAPFIYTIF